MSSNVKFYKANWKAIYDLLYVFHTNFDEYDAPSMWYNLRPLFDL